MEVKIIISSLGVGFGKTGFGANAFSGAYLLTRIKKGAPVDMYGIVSSLTLGSDSSTILVGHVATDWFTVDKDAHKVLSNRSNLLEKKAEIETSGTLLVSGKTTIKFTVFDKLGKGTTVIDLIDIPSSGGQLASTKVRGILKGVPAKKMEAVAP